ncbi:MAG TPA: glycosyltransferase family 4 protein [Marinilabiliaceae bacterium]|nr:glycosyltransferase family 4 protein [Marinilabiliaceae bacterium]
MTILFLYTELANYFLAGVKELSKNGHSVHIVRWPVNKEAPFEFEFPENVTVYDRDNYDTKGLINLANSIDPHLLITSGWIDRGYTKVSRSFKNRIPTLLTMDNQWHGTFRQKVMCKIAPWKLHRAFSKVWVPGEPQKEYALKLGFSEENIETGFYSADVPFFSPQAEARRRAEKYPHRLIYMGRYIHVKGMDLLFKAWMEICDEQQHDWELWCAGTGELYDQRPNHPQIKHLGFLQPHELKDHLHNAGAFVLPSRFEPWGVVVHEMAAAGFPLIVSSAVGSVTQFLQDGVNGYLFENESFAELKSALKKMISLSDDDLRNMAIKSHQLGTSYTPEMWARKVESYL